jgi:hypothetical protein
MVPTLTLQQRKVILRLGKPYGWDRHIEPEDLNELTHFGLIDVDDDRDVVLTDKGRHAYSKIKPADFAASLHCSRCGTIA